jgi:hypothetical protein
MLKRAFLAAVIGGFVLVSAQHVMADVQVRGYDREGYYRQDGTYVTPTHVQDHWRSNPDGDRSNNWSTKGNWNPYTGKSGYKSVIDHHR